MMFVPFLAINLIALGNYAIKLKVLFGKILQKKHFKLAIIYISSFTILLYNFLLFFLLIK